ncbi:hypothetical protein F3Y22_tig00110450pilonHSYRG01059 [Hibiscus syriacus]|uniref:Leucine-rich repeat-containing N-terminal plant-type domain-containing protein n=1 Tax=Hibiscus syriacus TaxID=106335 RepID=A0A6A3AMZ7_HIBSY|nr:hypothetical protein F3Y22_tig00110450pilonHSYRG01059 [Hibiscus syriacus]
MNRTRQRFPVEPAGPVFKTLLFFHFFIVSPAFLESKVWSFNLFDARFEETTIEVFSITDPGDLDVLMQFRDGLESSDLLKWPETGGDPCGPPSWNHVYCDHESRVTQIQAQGLGMKGTLPQNLNKLSVLNNIADLFDGLDDLEVLALDHNNFNATTGWSFPKALQNSAQLTNFSYALAEWESNRPRPIDVVATMEYLSFMVTGPILDNIGVELSRESSLVDSIETLCENISQLFFGLHISSSDQTLLYLLANEMAINLNMFGLFMEDRVGSNMKCNLIITPEFY